MSNENSSSRTPDDIWEDRFKRMEALVCKQGEHTQEIHRCLVGNALKNEDGLVHMVKRLSESDAATRKQLTEHAAKLVTHDDAIKEAATQKKTVLALLTAAGGAIGAGVSKIFSHGN